MNIKKIKPETVKFFSERCTVLRAFETDQNHSVCLVQGVEHKYRRGTIQTVRDYTVYIMEPEGFNSSINDYVTQNFKNKRFANDYYNEVLRSAQTSRPILVVSNELTRVDRIRYRMNGGKRSKANLKLVG